LINPWNLTGRKILVTGASSGIGRATSVLLSDLGASVVLVARNREQLRHTVSLMSGDSHRIEVRDLFDVESIPSWLGAVTQEAGPLHGLVHCAGIHSIRPLRFLGVDQIDQSLRLNVTAAIQLAKGFRQKNVFAAPASVVLLSSVLGLVGQSGATVYTASKSAIIGVVRSLALELASDGIRVNCIAPGQVHSEMTEKLEKSLAPDAFRAIEQLHPLGIGTPQDVAHAIVFLTGETGRWITGSTLIVDGGYTAH